MRFRLARSSTLAACLATALVGCAARPATQAPPKPQQQPTQAPPSAPVSETDPCPSQLHDIAGALLLYVNQEAHMPASLAELAPLMPPGSSVATAACPESRIPYIYMPEGIRIPDRDARIVLFDAAPNHGNQRWAVLVQEPRPGAPLITKVIPLPESFFLLHPPRSR